MSVSLAKPITTGLSLVRSLILRTSSPMYRDASLYRVPPVVSHTPVSSHQLRLSLFYADMHRGAVLEAVALASKIQSLKSVVTGLRPRPPYLLTLLLKTPGSLTHPRSVNE